LKIAVIGLWHLGTVTAGCLASVGHTVIGIEEDPALAAKLNQAELPVAEPGLAELFQPALANGSLTFTTDWSAAQSAGVVWIAYDTPVDEQDRADTGYVHARALRALQHMQDGAVLLISSQMPVGSIATLERDFAAAHPGKKIHFACSPENLRLGKAINVFLKPDRVVVGVRDKQTRETLEPVWAPFQPKIEWMSIESAEVTKHAINSFLATSIAFINEIASICERNGADALEVERGLKSDARIGYASYLHAGGAFSGGTLARDLAFLQAASARDGVALPLIDGVVASNDAHKQWLPRQIRQVFGENAAGRTAAMLGLTYKAGTNTLRRSAAVESARWLHSAGIRVQAFDPQINELPADLDPVIQLTDSMEAAMANADALVVMTPWPEFLQIPADRVPPVVFDAARFLEAPLSKRTGLRYFSIGRAL